MKKEKQVKKLQLSKETVKNLESGKLEGVHGGICMDSDMSCPSIRSRCC